MTDHNDIVAGMAAVEIAKLEARIQAMEKVIEGACAPRPQSYLDELKCLKAELAALFTLYKAAI